MYFVDVLCLIRQRVLKESYLKCVHLNVMVLMRSIESSLMFTIYIYTPGLLASFTGGLCREDLKEDGFLELMLGLWLSGSDHDGVCSEAKVNRWNFMQVKDRHSCCKGKSIELTVTSLTNLIILFYTQNMKIWLHKDKIEIRQWMNWLIMHSLFNIKQSNHMGPFLEVYSFAQNTIFFCMYSNMAFLEVYSFGREIVQNTLIWISNQIMPNHQFYIVENEVYSFININTCLIPKILSIMYGGVHFQECFNRDGNYCSNMIIICLFKCSLYIILSKTKFTPSLTLIRV